MCSWAKWWNTQIKVNPTHVHEQMGHPVSKLPWLLCGIAHTLCFSRTFGIIVDSFSSGKMGALGSEGPPTAERLSFFLMTGGESEDERSLYLLSICLWVPEAIRSL